MTDDAKPGSEKRDESKAAVKFSDLAREYNKALIQAQARIPLIGKPLRELDKALCDAGIGVRSLFSAECAVTDDVVADLRKQSLPSAKPDTARIGGVRPEA